MKKFGKVFALAVLIFLVGVNFASAMPAGDLSDFTISEKGDTVDSESPEEPPGSYGQSEPEPLSTSDEVDAQGPYGSSSNPYYEGDNVTFQAEMITGNVSDYYFAWDVDEDYYWDNKNWNSEKGQPNYTHKYYDDYIGPITVGAWDGVSYKNVSGNGTIFNETLPTLYESLGSEEYWTAGVKFTVKYDSILNELGIFNGSYEDIYNIRFWTDRGSLLVQVNDPNVSNNSWGWFNIAPIALSAGNYYIVSAGIKGNPIPCVEYPGLPPGDIVNPTDFMYSQEGPYSFPDQSYGDSPLPLVDVRFHYDSAYYDMIENYSEVYVLNVAPSVYAGEDVTGLVGETISFSGSFSDPGWFDSHDLIWDFDDGNVTIYDPPQNTPTSFQEPIM
jgi:hypothetical protein